MCAASNPFYRPSGIDEEEPKGEEQGSAVHGQQEFAMPPAKVNIIRQVPRGIAGRQGADRGLPPAADALPEGLALIDFTLLDEIFDNFREVTGLPIAVLDPAGRVLSSSPWQRLCLEFHRTNEATLAGCLRSDSMLAQRLRDGADCAVHQCANGLIDCATPIVIEGRHVATLITGQFLPAAADVEFFKRQQIACGFDEKEYFQALAEVPVVAPDRIAAVTRLLRGLAQQIARLCLAEQRAASGLGEVEGQADDRMRKLAQSEDRFRAMFQGSPVGQLLIEPDSLRILECNPAAADIHGCRREDLVGLTIAELDREQDEQAIRAIADRLIEDGRTQFETRVRRRDGDLRDLAVTVVAFRAAEGFRFHGTYVDVTERKRAEREQQRLRRALRLLGDCNLSMVQVEDEATLLDDVCRLVVDTGGYRMAWIGVPEDDAEKSVRPIAQSDGQQDYLEGIRVSWDAASDLGRGPTGTAIRTGTSQINQSIVDDPTMTPWRRAAAAHGYRSSIALPLVGKRQTLGVLTIYAAEADAFNAGEVALLEELARNLTFGIETLRMRRQREAAESASRAKSAFLANMSHEIRTPLHAIIGLAYLLRRDTSDSALRERLDQLCASSDHLLAIINDVLDLSKIEADRLALERQPFAIDGVVDKVMRTVEGRAREKGLAMSAEVAPGLRGVEVSGDALRLTQVLMNLCGNAVKFTPSGKVELRVALRSEADAALTVSFAVEDTGIGIAPADQVRLFRPFEQVDDSATREHDGTGLGLAISQRLVAMMGGDIRVDSCLGRGSRFSFDLVLPRALERAGEAVPPVVACRTFGGKRVLLAEDNPLSQEIMLEMLEDLGCEVDVAVDGIEAVDCVRERSYDLILMDMQMPRLDGIAATRAIRALPGGDMPIIALTANAFADDRQRCLAAGMNGHVGKPVNPVTLAATLERWLSGLTMPDDLLPSDGDSFDEVLAQIGGLDVGKVWRRSPERLAAYRGQLERFLEEHRDDMAKLRERLAAGDRSGAHAVVHRLKGIAGLIGAWRIESLAGQMMFGLRDQLDTAAIERLAIDCQAEMGDLAESVRQLPPVPADATAVDAQAGPT